MNGYKDMKHIRYARRKVIGLLITQLICLILTQYGFSQTETLGMVQYTPPAGWAKTYKEGAIVYSDVNKATGGYCVLTVYTSTASAGTAQKDFANAWRDS